MNFDSVLIVGFGNIGRAMVDLLLGNFDLDPRKLHIFERNYVGKTLYMGYQLSVHDRTELTKENYVEILAPFLNDKTFLLNLGVEVSSHDLMMLCREREAYYLDTSIEPWAYDRENDSAQIPTTNYAPREAILEEKRTRSAAKTAIVAHGANPGFVSILLKKGLRKMQVDFLNRIDRPNSREGWGKLCHELGIRVIQVSERDTQTRLRARESGEFVNTWSVDGLVTECLQPAELGWGSHESQLPLGSVSHQFGCRAAIALRESGLSTRIRSWSPNTLGFDGLVVTHNEAISIADFLTVYQDGEVKYRPTSYFAYRPSDMTNEQPRSKLRGILKQRELMI
ncbi:Homospermidine synthase [Paraburkholderia aspalathi]|uniref:saccharopine dehydrogenase NADP-binding domain-containing protein n=1 Tax=Paraburkholderia aspalathi TaxID=1324617 RepID=UPI00190B3FB8|nr:saccharopine dehydrogenase NADP-binding domain-containing protein [Paraburkholderia aspalathi]MBK3844569.1 hypothetical protein [Paraburkholderia aspalathi]CAE6874625.1 Homospermidine synthase [Paraburkholderia aspalathi]